MRGSTGFLIYSLSYVGRIRARMPGKRAQKDVAWLVAPTEKDAMPPSAPDLATGESPDLALQLSWLEQLASEGNEGLVVTDPQGRCLLVNDLAVKFAGGVSLESGALTLEVYLSRLREQSQSVDDAWSKTAGPLNMMGLVASRRWLRFTSSANSDSFAGQERHYALVPYALRNGNGRVTGYALFLRDMTSMLQDNTLEDTLLSSISHDVRTPLMVIKAAVTGLLQEGLQWDETLRREMLQDINEETDRLNTLVSALLEMSRIQGGALQLQTEWCDLAEIIHTVLDRLQKITCKHRVVYEMNAPLPLVQGDFMQLDRVLTNLIENAVKYSPEGTQITITTSAGESEIQVSVCDEGCGIAPEERERIFEKFYRVKHRRISRVHAGCNKLLHEGKAGRSVPVLAGGSGLGLAICRGIITAHRGRIWVEGRAEGGSRFVFTLPVEPSAPRSGRVFRESGPLAQRVQNSAVPGQEMVKLPTSEVGWERSDEPHDAH